MNYFNPSSPIDCAWETRVPAFMREAEYSREGHFADAHKCAVNEPIKDGFTETCGEWRLRQWREADAHVKAWRQSHAYQTRPFRFEDLHGKPEPASWGPAYPKTASAAVEKWRRVSLGRDLSPDEMREYGASVGAWIRGLNAVKGHARISLACTAFNPAKHRAALRAAFQAQAGADRRAWALGQSKNERNETIREAYARAMAEKAARLAGEPMREAA